VEERIGLCSLVKERKGEGRRRAKGMERIDRCSMLKEKGLRKDAQVMYLQTCLENEKRD
jgi:hypothetical protein